MRRASAPSVTTAYGRRDTSPAPTKRGGPLHHAFGAVPLPRASRKGGMRGRNGFTLIELLVALAVFSLGVLALLNVSGESTRTAGAIEERVLAGVVADNRAVEVMAAVEPPPVGVSDGVERAGDRAWRWTRTVSATADPAILRVDVRVAAADGTRTVAEVSLFRARL